MSLGVVSFMGVVAAYLLPQQSVPGTATVDAPVLARAVEKGEVLRTGDFKTAAVPVMQARGAVAPEDAAGREAVRLLRAGYPVRAADIAVPRVVRRGEAVTIVVVNGGLRIAAPGRSLGDAGPGEPVRVVNLSTNRTLDGVAEAGGQVRVAAQ